MRFIITIATKRKLKIDVKKKNRNQLMSPTQDEPPSKKKIKKVKKNAFNLRSEASAGMLSSLKTQTKLLNHQK